MIVPHNFEIALVNGKRDSRTPNGLPPFSEATIAQIAATMVPGEFRAFSAGYPAGVSSYGGVFYRGMTINNDSADFWGTVSEWDPIGRRVWSLMDRTAGGNTVASFNNWAYNANTHKWEFGGLDLPREANAPHTYSHWSIDRVRRKTYRVLDSGTYIYDMATQEWTESAGVPGFGSQNGTAFHQTLDRLLIMNASGQVSAWDPETGVVTVLPGAHPTQKGRHSHAIYNPLREEVLIFTGDTTRAVTLIGSDGVVRPQDDTPEGVFGGFGQGGMFEFYDPVTGHYLAYQRSNKQIWEFDPDAVGTKWALAKDLNGTPDEGPVYHGFHICTIPEAGVILWQHRQSVRLYKHQGVL